MGKINDLSGKRFGKLLVIKQGPYLNVKNNRVTWDCICDCGNNHNIRTSALTSGGSKSCGCGKIKLKPGEAAFNRLYGEYKRNAKTKNKIFNLSKIEFRKIVEQHCYYCAQPPNNEKRPAKGNNGSYFSNGIDRIDNDIGYIKENCVPCCTTCNFAKRQMSKIEFAKWVNKISSNFNTHLSFFERIRYLYGNK